MIDCHNHLQDERLGRDREDIVEELRNLGVGYWLVNGTSATDWDAVAGLARSYPEVIPFFGLHPWKTKGRADDWLQQLDEHLREFPASCLGEIGLDKWIRDADFPDQIEVFRRQLDLAAQLERPVAVHCLQAWGTMAEILKEYRGSIRFLLHSYGGPLEMLDTFTEIGAFYSISGYFFREGKETKRDVFREIPVDRLLVETDAPDMPLPADRLRFQIVGDGEGAEINHPANIVAVYEAVSDLLNTEIEELIARVTRNASIWLGRQLS